MQRQVIHHQVTHRLYARTHRAVVYNKRGRVVRTRSFHILAFGQSTNKEIHPRNLLLKE